MARVYFPMDKTPEQWRADAAACFKAADDSFDRSDTDGSLSQWANQMTARIYRVCAEVAERGGKWDFEMLADIDGNIIEEAREVKTPFGWAWVIPDKLGGDPVWFNPSKAQDPERRRLNNLMKGFQLVTVERDAVVTTVEGGLWGLNPIIIPKRS